LFTDFERFWFCFWFKSFSKWFCLRIRWFTTVVTRFKPWNLLRFWKFFRVSWFLNQNSSNSLRIYIDLDFVVVHEYEEVSFWVSPGFIRRFGLNLQKPLVWFCFLLILAGDPKINRDLFFFFFFSGSKSSNSWFILLFLLLCDRIRVCCFQWRIWCLNCRGQGSMMKIHHWISES